MADVFVSYAHEDRDAVLELAAVMERDGYDVWWDRALDVGVDFADEIEKQISSASAVVVVWSKASVTSRWVRSEANAAFDQDKLVPVNLDGADVPMPFSSAATAQLTDWPSKPCQLEMTKFRRALFKQTGSAQPQGLNLNLKDSDPSLSVRVASRVAGMMQEKGDEVTNTLLAIEQAISDAALQIAANGDRAQILNATLARLQSALQADIFNLVTNNATIGNCDLVEQQEFERNHPIIFVRDDASVEVYDWLSRYGVAWAFIVSGSNYKLGFGAYAADVPSNEIKKRAPALGKLFELLTSD